MTRGLTALAVAGLLVAWLTLAVVIIADADGRGLATVDLAVGAIGLAVAPAVIALAGAAVLEGRGR